MKLFHKEAKSGSELSPGRDLRTRYVPRARIRPFYLQAAPWLDLLFILFFLVLAQSRIVLRPGVVIALPAHEGIGVQGGSIAVLVPNMRAGRLEPMVYFADEAFRLDDSERVEALGGALEGVLAAGQMGTLTLYADQRVSQTYILQVIDIASKAGFDQLNIGTVPSILPSP